MKKLVEITQPIKAFAAIMFAGLICLYMVSGILYAFFTGAEISHSIPFVFIIQGMGLTLAIAILRELVFADFIIKKWRFFQRVIAFSILLIILLGICTLTFLAIPTEWSALWLISASILALGVTVISGISEIYYRKTGAWYNEMLRVYKNTK
ncbi:MAG: hypothetical protein FWD82_05625 [Defluviitaleaceae bacterium]|nr:hypothetical protein [Defluviitaleaceae bacterium]